MTVANKNRCAQKIHVETTGERLDIFLTRVLAGRYTRSQITNSIKDGLTTLNNKAVKSGTILHEGDTVDVNIVFDEPKATAEDIALDVVFEDDDLMVVNKPRGMIVHPGAGVNSGTLLNGLLGRGTNLERAGIVHRLDKNTAGLLVVAKTAAMQAKLSEMFEKRDIRRIYVGLVEGILNGTGTIDKNIARDSNRRTLYKVVPTGGRKAVTHFKVVRNFSKWTLVQFELETGRTHQIRVHCKAIGHPIVGDPEYNPSSSIKELSGQMLESIKLSFVHPKTLKTVLFETETTKEFSKTVDRII